MTALNCFQVKSSSFGGLLGFPQKGEQHPVSSVAESFQPTVSGKAASSSAATSFKPTVSVSGGSTKAAASLTGSPSGSLLPSVSGGATKAPASLTSSPSGSLLPSVSGGATKTATSLTGSPSGSLLPPVSGGSTKAAASLTGSPSGSLLPPVSGGSTKTAAPLTSSSAAASFQPTVSGGTSAKTVSFKQENVTTPIQTSAQAPTTQQSSRSDVVTYKPVSPSGSVKAKIGLFQKGPYPLQTKFEEHVVSLTKASSKEQLEFLKTKGKHISEEDALSIIKVGHNAPIEKLIEILGDNLSSACLDALLEKRLPKAFILLIKTLKEQLGEDDLLKMLAKTNNNNIKVQLAMLEHIGHDVDLEVLEKMAERADSTVLLKMLELKGENLEPSLHASFANHDNPEIVNAFVSQFFNHLGDEQKEFFANHANPKVALHLMNQYSNEIPQNIQYCLASHPDASVGISLIRYEMQKNQTIRLETQEVLAKNPNEAVPIHLMEQIIQKQQILEAVVQRHLAVHPKSKVVITFIKLFRESLHWSATRLLSSKAGDKQIKEALKAANLNNPNEFAFDNAPLNIKK